MVINPDPYICCIQESHLKPRDIYRMKGKGLEKVFHVKRDQKKAKVAILIPEKTDWDKRHEMRQKDHFVWWKDQSKKKIYQL